MHMTVLAEIPLGAAADDSTSPEIDRVWNSSRAIQEEFGSKKTFAAFYSAQAAGRVRFCGAQGDNSGAGSVTPNIDAVTKLHEILGLSAESTAAEACVRINDSNLPDVCRALNLPPGSPLDQVYQAIGRAIEAVPAERSLTRGVAFKGAQAIKPALDPEFLWNASPAIRAEFTSKENFAAYYSAERRGLVKFVGVQRR